MSHPGRSKGEHRSAQHQGSTAPHLLDANALIALCWPTHEHHLRMLAWFRQHASKGWATTALTQAAFVRIISQQVIAGRSVSIGEVAELFENALLGRFQGVFAEVVFAITDWSDDQRFIGPFVETFGSSPM